MHTAIVRQDRAKMLHHNRHVQNLALAAAATSVIVAAKASPVPPSWASEVHATHDLWLAGGFLYCARCGSLAQSVIGSSLLFKMCRAHDNECFTIPSGSVSRLKRIEEGKNPVLHAKSWPDGQPAHVTVQCHRVARTQPAAPAEAALVYCTESSDEDVPIVAPPLKVARILPSDYETSVVLTAFRAGVERTILDQKPDITAIESVELPKAVTAAALQSINSSEHWDLAVVDLLELTGHHWPGVDCTLRPMRGSCTS